MNQPDPSGSGESIAKRTRSNTKKFRINQEQIADILKLDIDCLEELFDYLPLNDLVSMGKTCKRLQRVAGYCFQQNYLGYAVCSDVSDGIVSFRLGIKLDYFFPFIREIDTSRDSFKHLLDESWKLQQLKRINICEYDDIDRLKEMNMSNIEVLHLSNCHLSKNFHEVIDHCPKLRRLHVKNCVSKYNNSSDYSWLNGKYPTLEALEFTDYGYQIVDIATVLELNQNIREFTTKESLLVKNRDRILSANIKLDILAVHVPWPQHQQPKKKFYDFLNELHEHGFYQKLHLQFHTFPKSNQEYANQLATVNALVRLYIGSEISQSFGVLKDLEDLYLWECTSIVNYEMLANELINLQRLYLDIADSAGIMAFIRKSVKLHTISMGNRCNMKETGLPYHKDAIVIDLLALNRVREKLPNAKKITLYIDEETYLATKQAFGGVDCRLIRLKRLNMTWLKSERNEYF